MSDLGNKEIMAFNIKRLLEKHSMTMKDLSTELNIPYTTVCAWCKAETYPRIDKIEMMANFFGINKADLVESYAPCEKECNSKGVRIPVYGYIRAGIPVEAISEILDYEEIPQDMAKNGEYFALQVRGDSMLPELREGDVVIVKAQNDIETGEMAIVAVNGDDATVKRVIKSNSGITLIPSNTTYPPIIYSGADITNLPVEIKGKVVELRRKF